MGTSKAGRPLGSKSQYFSKVKQARQLLMERAEEILTQYLQVVEEARQAGEFEVATKSLQFLIEHMPEDQGDTMVDVSIDKPKQIEQRTGPTVNIGIKLGGMTKPKELPPSVIDVTPEK